MRKEFQVYRFQISLLDDGCPMDTFEDEGKAIQYIFKKLETYDKNQRFTILPIFKN